MPLQEFVVHFNTGKNLWLTLKNAFVWFLALKNDIVENFVTIDDRCYVYVDAKLSHSFVDQSECEILSNYAI